MNSFKNNMNSFKNNIYIALFNHIMVRQISLYNNNNKSFNQLNNTI